MFHELSLFLITTLEPPKLSQSSRDLLKLDSSCQILIIASSKKHLRRGVPSWTSSLPAECWPHECGDNFWFE
ncbi:unnamed protein product [Linum tenue]|uniref:Uncharacterized protein n=1 Tax=Linum tenue TaxID=586396 RepID=A0AAV0R0C2_9ROSI|nr:unnamed protein product [Linum tenue]